MRCREELRSKIKSSIKKNYCGRLFISELHCIESWLRPKIIDDESAIRMYYKKKMGKDLDLDNPLLFSEKMNWYKLHNRNPLMQKCADKLSVREYVSSAGYSDCLNHLLGVYDRACEINPSTLPERFVLKASHGSHMSLVVKDNKNEINWNLQKLLMQSWLHQNIYWSAREWVYRDIPRRIIAEAYLEDETGELKDYKFFCFNGKPYYMQFDGNRLSESQYRNFYDMEMNCLPIMDTVPNRFDAELPITREVFEKMKKVSADLAAPFQFVRVDLYAVESKVFFGELTFFDAGGQCNMEPKEWDEIWGRNWHLEE